MKWVFFMALICPNSNDYNLSNIYFISSRCLLNGLIVHVNTDLEIDDTIRYCFYCLIQLGRLMHLGNFIYLLVFTTVHFIGNADANIRLHWWESDKMSFTNNTRNINYFKTHLFWAKEEKGNGEKQGCRGNFKYHTQFWIWTQHQHD